MEQSCNFLFASRLSLPHLFHTKAQYNVFELYMRKWCIQKHTFGTVVWYRYLWIGRHRTSFIRRWSCNATLKQTRVDGCMGWHVTTAHHQKGTVKMTHDTTDTFHGDGKIKSVIWALQPSQIWCDLSIWHSPDLHGDCKHQPMYILWFSWLMKLVSWRSICWFSQTQPMPACDNLEELGGE